jgi:hypothetical protein
VGAQTLFLKEIKMENSSKILTVNLGVALNRYCHKDGKGYPVTFADLKNFIHTLSTFGVSDDVELDDCDIYVSLDIDPHNFINLQNTSQSSSYTIYTQSSILASE